MKKEKNKYLVVLMVISILFTFYTLVFEKYNNRQEQDKYTAAVSYVRDEIPEYSGDKYVYINNNDPNFEEKYFSETSFEIYSDLDSLGRCGVAFANIGR